MPVLNEREALLDSIQVAVEQFTTLYSKKCEEGRPRDIAEAICLHEASPTVIAKLEKEPVFLHHESRMIRSENGSSSFHPRFVAPKLIKKAVEAGNSEVAVTWLEKVLATGLATGFSIMAVWGVRVDRAVQMGNRVSLVPIGELPDSYQKRWILEKDWLQSQLDVIPMSFMDAPTAALVVETVIDPLFIDSETDKPVDVWQSNRELLEDARLALSMLGPCAPLQACSWFNFKDPDIADAQLGAARSSGHIEIMPIRVAQPEVLDAELASSLVGRYLSLEGSVKQRLRVALERLNQGLRRFRPGDQAMEISIALETLLADGGTENTYKIGLRTALLLGGDTATRQENRAIVGGAYIMRSALVHSGTVSDEIKVPRLGKIPAYDVAKRAAKICGEVIQGIIKRGHIPEWFEFELQPHDG